MARLGFNSARLAYASGVKQGYLAVKQKALAVNKAHPGPSPKRFATALTADSPRRASARQTVRYKTRAGLSVYQQAQLAEAELRSRSNAPRSAHYNLDRQVADYNRGLRGLGR